MVKKVGIPKGLFYYKYFPLWKTFFEELGAEVVVSKNTTKKTLDEGIKFCVDDVCLPIKIFYGHVLDLRDKVDYIFIPKLVSVSKNEYICPKFSGLPDMIKHSISDIPKIIDTEINLRKSKSNVLSGIYEIGGYFTNNSQQIKKAYNKALIQHSIYKEEIKKGRLPNEIIDKKLTLIEKKRDFENKEDNLNIALVGHVYNIYDNYINMNLVQKLKNQNVELITIDMIDEDIINKKVSSLNKRMFWNFGRKGLGSSIYLSERKDIDGIIYIMSFGCGIDSFISDLAERKIRKIDNIPFIVLNIDEHSGEAGMDTRIEAFIDMVKWRKKNENDISAHG